MAKQLSDTQKINAILKRLDTATKPIPLESIHIGTHVTIEQNLDIQKNIKILVKGILKKGYIDTIQDVFATTFYEITLSGRKYSRSRKNIFTKIIYWLGQGDNLKWIIGLIVSFLTGFFLAWWDCGN